MKPIPLVLLAAMFSVTAVFSEEETFDDSRNAVTLPITARVLGNISDGTPPPPEPTTPGFVVRAKDVLSSKTHWQGGRNITIQQIAPIQLPPRPLEVPAVDIDNPVIQQRIADAREREPAGEFLFVSAAVFHPKDSAPRTFVNIWAQGHGDSVSFWSSADFALLSGFCSFVGSDGIERSFIMAWSPQEIESIGELIGNAAEKSELPAVPEFVGDKATFAITTGKPAIATLAAIQALHDLYNNEHDRLKAAYNGRENARLQQEAELRAHPPRPKNIVLNFWRTTSPVKGGVK